MKRKLILCLTISLLISSFSSFAADKEQLVKIDSAAAPTMSAISANDKSDPNYKDALTLEQLNVFRGTGAGLELGRKPTRIEGAVMFVRLLGKEGEALEKKYSHPFTDVPAWANDYVGYLYKFGLTKGIGDNKFGSSDILNLRNYLTFILRCLGYSDNKGDFKVEQAEEKAMDIKVIDEEPEDTDVFNRSELAKVSVAALGTEMKDSDVKLIDTIKVPDNGNYYAAIPTAITGESWLTTYAGGIDKQFDIQLGKLIRSNCDFSEVYIDLIVNDQVTTLAANGGSYEYDEGTNQLKRSVINFLTGKKFDGNEVVKDYSGGFISLVMIIEYDNLGIGTPTVLFYSTQGNNELDYPKDNYYQLVLESKIAD